MNIDILKKIGFSDKSAKVYLALLRLGPSSVRSIADACELNRGTAYDSLKWLQEQGVVNYFHKDTKQHFVAENPEKLHMLIKQQQSDLYRVDKALEQAIPEMQALFHKGGERPIAKYFAQGDIAKILEDVLLSCEQGEEKMYRIYSAETVREHLYTNFPTFSDARIAKGIDVRVISIGEGGELRGLDERKWLTKDTAGIDSSTYIIIYPGKTAYISLNAKQEPVGVVIENDGVYATQKLIFDRLWDSFM